MVNSLPLKIHLILRYPQGDSVGLGLPVQDGVAPVHLEDPARVDDIVILFVLIVRVPITGLQGGAQALGHGVGPVSGDLHLMEGPLLEPGRAVPRRDGFHLSAQDGQRARDARVRQEGRVG